MKCPISASFEKATEKIIPNSLESSIGVMAARPRASMAAIGCTNLDSIKTSEKFAPAPRGDKTAAEQSVSHQNPQTRGNLQEHKKCKANNVPKTCRSLKERLYLLPKENPALSDQQQRKRGQFRAQKKSCTNTCTLWLVVGGNDKIKGTSRAHRSEHSMHNQADDLMQKFGMDLAAPVEQKGNKSTPGLWRISRINEAEIRTRSGNSVLPFGGGQMLKIFLNQLDVRNDMALSLLYLDYPCFIF